MYSYFSFIAATVGLILALHILRRRRRFYQLMWGVGLLMFAVATGAEGIATLWGWNVTLVHIYYLFGPTLVVAYLGLGNIYLLARRLIANLSCLTIVILSIMAVSAVFGATVDTLRLSSEGWRALQRTLTVDVLTITLNVLGLFPLVGGAVYAAWAFWQRGAPMKKFFANTSIAVGALILVSGTLIKFYGDLSPLFNALGIIIMYNGFLRNL